MSYLQIYKASAGSGKTHTLTQDYLKLAFTNEMLYAAILAVTFTNKASEEMKDRIITELNTLSTKGSKSGHYEVLAEVMQTKDEGAIKNRAQNIINNILHNYSQFSVSTIDSFVQKVVRAFSFELGIQSGYKIEMDSTKVIDELSELLYKKAEDDPSLLKWLVKYAFHKMEAGQSWDFREELKNLAREILKEDFHQFRPTTQGEGDNEMYRKKLNAFLNGITELKKTFEQEMATISKRATDVLSPLDKDIKLGKAFTSITNHLTKKIISGKTSDLEPVKTVRAALDGMENWHAKSAKPNIISTISTYYEELNSCLEDAIENFDRYFPLYLSAKNVIANFHAFGILNDLAELLPLYRDENNLLLISDTTILLREIIANNDAPFIYEKVGNRYSNILIDEFQDTSAFQWDNFNPLMQNSLADGNFNLIVGDIKQSIYRWRGGDWKLLLHGVTDSIGKDMITEKSLDTNWRSKENVINFNNALFCIAPKLLQEGYNKELNAIMVAETREALKEKKYHSVINDAYSDSYQHISPNKSEGGRVIANFIKVEKASEKTRKWREAIIQRLPETIDDLIKNKKYQPRDITLLVRRNKDGKEIVEILNNYLSNKDEKDKYQIVSGESLYVSGSGAVKLLISAMRFLNDSRDKLSLASLVYEYNSFVPPKDVAIHDIFNIHHEEDAHLAMLPEEFIAAANMLKKMPLFEMAEELIRIFQLQKLTKEQPYIRTFQDMVLNFTRNENTGLHDFVVWWEKNGHKQSIQMSDKQNAVKVMTLHKSKGLAFKIVIIPFCDWPLDHNHINAPVIWCKPKQPPFDSYPTMPIQYKQELAKTIFAEQYFEEKLQVQMDALNMLYVACTRAEDELITFSPYYDDKINNIGDVLHQSVLGAMDEALPQSNEKKFIPIVNYYDAETNQLILDNAYTPEIKAEQYKNNDPVKLDEYPLNSWRSKMSIAHNSSDFFIESVDYIEERVNYGLMMHQILSQIDSTEDIEQVLAEMYFSGKITTTQRNELTEKVAAILQRPIVKSWYEPHWNVKAECAIITAKGKIRIPDRILFGKNEIVVIDFKFGKQRDEYHEQIKEYMTLVKEIEDKPITGYLYYAEQDIAEAVEL